jgi:uncharacterized protein (DUF1778 family)
MIMNQDVPNEAKDNTLKVIEKANKTIVSSEEYDWLMQLMDEQVPTPRLRKALDQAPIWSSLKER